MRAKLPARASEDELPFHSDLEVGPPAWGEDNDLLAVTGQQFDDVAGEFTKFRESSVTSVALLGGTLSGSVFRDVWLGTVRLAGVALHRTDWLDSYVRDGAWSGIQATEAVLGRVRFTDCRFETVNFRGSKLTEVEFVDCDLVDLDLAQCALKNVTFAGCRLAQLHLGGGARAGVDLSGARELRIADGLEDLSGLVLSRAQAEGLAVALATRAGATVLR